MSDSLHIKSGYQAGEMYLPGGSVYFLGIGGIGMSALARYFHSRSIKVSGYDKTPTELTRQLEAEGISIHYVDDVNKIDKEAKLVVITPAVPADHKELNYYKSNDYEVRKRSEVLGMITGASYNICIAGTHGKTTTSAMVAHLLRHSGVGCNAFLGGIAANYSTNFWSSENNVCVAEADEYDRSFLTLRPDVAAITSMDADHLDIYGTEKNMQDAFLEFSGKVKESGLLIYKKGIQRQGELQGERKCSYSLSDTQADAFSENVKVEDGGYRYDITVKNKRILDVYLNMGGRHNIENSIVAVAVGLELGIDEDKIRAAVAAFKGVKRRFEYILKNEERVFVDDYAHHPQELKALLDGVKDLYPGEKVTMVFQPHLFSRTRDHADGFAEVLDLADEILLLPIYPARELPMEGVNSEMIASRMRKAVRVVDMKNLPDIISKLSPRLLVTAGAGDIDTMVEPIKDILSLA